MTSVSSESPCKMIECSMAPLVLGEGSIWCLHKEILLPHAKMLISFCIHWATHSMCSPTILISSWWEVMGYWWLGEAESLPLSFATFSSLVWCKPMFSGVCLCFHRLQLIRKCTWIHEWDNFFWLPTLWNSRTNLNFSWDKEVWIEG